MKDQRRIQFGGLTHILLQNFKAFGRLQRIPIRPITLIYGKNNSGKSSIIQALLYAEHVRRTGEMNAPFITKDGQEVLQGGLSRLTHGHQGERPRFGWEWKNPKSLTGLDSGAYLQELGDWDVNLRTTLNGVEFFRLEGDKVWDGPYPDRAHPTLVQTVENIQKWLAKEYHLVAETTESTPEVRRLLLNECPTLESGGFTSPILEELFAEIHGLRIDKIGLPPTFRYLDLLQSDWESTEGRVGFRSTSLLARSFEDADEKIRWRGDASPQLSWGVSANLERHVEDFIVKRAAMILFRWLEDMWAHFSQPLDALVRTIHYLGAVRRKPDRVILREPEDRGGVGRDKRGMFPQQQRDWIFQSSAIEAANKWIRRHKGLTGDIEILLNTFQSDSYAGALPANLEIMERKRKVTLGFNEVGFGISQFLPILLACFAQQDQYLDEGAGTLVIEEPEAHVHPALQAELGDLFLQAISRKQRPLAYIVAETHSEHLLLRIMRRIRQGTLSASKVSVLYVENLGKESVIREMPLNEKGELVRDWPGGFFEEGLREVLL